PYGAVLRRAHVREVLRAGNDRPRAVLRVPLRPSPLRDARPVETGGVSEGPLRRELQRASPPPHHGGARRERALSRQARKENHLVVCAARGVFLLFRCGGTVPLQPEKRLQLEP
ncbi:unnamed protein product, partial [Ectocarpus fasciculatus]